VKESTLAAKISDVPAEHQRHARLVDVELLDSLTPAELRHRAAYAARLADDAKQAAIPEHSKYLNQRARAVMRSKAALDFLQRDKELSQMVADAPRTISHDGQGNAQSVAGAYGEMRRHHRDQNSYPPGLLEALDQPLLGKTVADSQLRDVVGAIIAGTA
jgi:hypothetical protein